ncbi:MULTISPECIES: hypothetical protein [Rathayibacter]|nr:MULTISPECIES: hypothetical protein [Rathayibacter]MCJ1697202.1 hypothetical protein [Rathayibacter caricis]
MTAAVMADPARHGRTTISSRAVRRIVSAVTADALDVGPSDVSVDLDDDGGSLHVVAQAPIRVSPLGETDRRSSGTLLDRLAEAQTLIRDRCLELTGSSIGRVDLRITGVDLRERRRVS